MLYINSFAWWVFIVSELAILVYRRPDGDKTWNFLVPTIFSSLISSNDFCSPDFLQSLFSPENGCSLPYAAMFCWCFQLSILYFSPTPKKSPVIWSKFSEVSASTGFFRVDLVPFWEWCNLFRRLRRNFLPLEMDGALALLFE